MKNLYPSRKTNAVSYFTLFNFMMRQFLINYRSEFNSEVNPFLVFVLFLHIIKLCFRKTKLFPLFCGTNVFDCFIENLSAYKTLIHFVCWHQCLWGVQEACYQDMIYHFTCILGNIKKCNIAEISTCVK